MFLVMRVNCDQEAWGFDESPALAVIKLDYLEQLLKPRLAMARPLFQGRPAPNTISWIEQSVTFFTIPHESDSQEYDLYNKVWDHEAIVVDMLPPSMLHREPYNPDQCWLRIFHDDNFFWRGYDSYGEFDTVAVGYPIDTSEISKLEELAHAPVS